MAILGVQVGINILFVEVGQRGESVEVAVDVQKMCQGG